MFFFFISIENTKKLHWQFKIQFIIANIIRQMKSAVSYIHIHIN